MSVSMDIEVDRPGRGPAGFDDAIPISGRKVLSRRCGTQFVRPSYGLVNRAVQASDVLACILAPALLRTAWIVSAEPLTLAQTVMIGVLMAAAFLFALRMSGAYRVERYRRAEWSVVDVVAGWVAAVGVVVLVLWAFDPAMLGAKRWMLSWTLTLLGVLMVERAVLFLFLRRAIRAGLLRRHAAVVGSGPLAEDMRARLLAAEDTGSYRFEGLYGDDGASGDGLSGDIDDLCNLALERRLEWISADVVAPIERTTFLSAASHATQVAGAPAMILAHHPFKGTEGLVKVLEDYVVATTALILLSPVMLAVAMVLKLEGKGPILFRQDRVGFNGRSFRMFKFRTMTVDPNDDGSLGTTKDNPRITKVGAFLRGTSLDELPQLFNVLRGEMSVVGPRPHVPNMFVEERSYAETVRAYAARHRIKPGITGWAQINGMRGGIDSVAKASRGVELDLHYIKAWSLRFDLTIMLRTLVRHMSGPSVF
jgi:lipopolysaccharide/colanic/teichoic acid biosynthesis glycosyltransferase